MSVGGPKPAPACCRPPIRIAWLWEKPRTAPSAQQASDCEATSGSLDGASETQATRGYRQAPGVWTLNGRRSSPRGLGLCSVVSGHESLLEHRRHALKNHLRLGPNPGGETGSETVRREEDDERQDEHCGAAEGSRRPVGQPENGCNSLGKDLVHGQPRLIHPASRRHQLAPATCASSSIRYSDSRLT